MLDKSKLSPELIKFLIDRNIPEEAWEEYLKNNCTTINVNEFPVVDNSLQQNVIDEILSLGTPSEPTMTLYETNIMGVTNVGGEKGNAYLRFLQKSQSPYCKLEYFKEFNGQKDVIKETWISPDKDNVISYYTICSEDDKAYALTTTSRNDHILDLSWKQNIGITSFALVRFKAFKDKGVTFVNDNINALVDEYNKIMEHKTMARCKK